MKFTLTNKLRRCPGIQSRDPGQSAFPIASAAPSLARRTRRYPPPGLQCSQTKWWCRMVLASNRTDLPSRRTSRTRPTAMRVCRFYTRWHVRREDRYGSDRDRSDPRSREPDSASNNPERHNVAMCSASHIRGRPLQSLACFWTRW